MTHVDRFVFNANIVQVPALENRLSAMCIALTAKETCQNISNQADIILNAVSQVCLFQ